VNLHKTWVRVVLVMVVAVLVGIGSYFAISTAADARSSSRAAREQSAENKQLILRVFGCQPDDSPEACAERQAQRSRDEGVARIKQVDCITRRALAGMPAPIPPDNCTSQTPPNIYPGGNP